jgi:hypothetical protein
MRRPSEFNSEAEMCAAFIAWLARFPGWTAFAETEGWDILLVHADGTQIGVQAKLKCNIKVLEQAVDSWWGSNDTGPDFRAILAPSTETRESLCAALGIGTFSGRRDLPVRPDESARYSFDPPLDRSHYRAWHYHNPEKRHELPRYVPDVPAGVPSPTPLTKWKIAALEIVAILELRGFVTRADFQLAGIDHRRWTELWLEPDLKSGAWRRGSNFPDFAGQHRIVYPQVLADVRDRIAGQIALPTP